MVTPPTQTRADTLRHGQTSNDGNGFEDRQLQTLADRHRHEPTDFESKGRPFEPDRVYY